jgi:hypothetical protein
VQQQERWRAIHVTYRAGDAASYVDRLLHLLRRRPPIPSPWPELGHIHFGDRLVYVLAGLDS